MLLWWRNIRCKPDLVLMDITMPDMDGIQALKNQRDRSECKYYHVFCNGTAGNELLKGSSQSKGFVVKPFRQSVLEAVKSSGLVCYFSKSDATDRSTDHICVCFDYYLLYDKVGRWFSKTQMSKGNLTVLETIRIANGKFLQLVKAGEQYFVIAVGKDEVTRLQNLQKISYQSVHQMI